MDRKTSNKLLTFSSIALAVAGLMLLFINIFSDTKDSSMLTYALSAILLSNVFNIIRIQQKKKDDEDK